MNRNISRSLPVLSLTLLAAPVVSHAQYMAFDLGVISGPNTLASKAFAINNSGYITGYVNTLNGGTSGTTAFLINGNSLTPAPGVSNTGALLGTTGGTTTSSNGYGINNNNVVSGNSSMANGGGLRGAYFNPTPHDAGVSTGTSGVLRAINDNGLAVGFSNTGATAVTYQIGSGATSLTPLTVFPAGTTVSQALGVNNSGQIAGYYGTPFMAGTPSIPAKNQAFRYDTATNTRVDFGTLGGATVGSDSNGGGFGINASGKIAGFSLTATGALHGFLYTGTGTTLSDLGTLVPGSNDTSVTSTAYSINTQGDVVGNSKFVGSIAGNTVPSFHAYIYKAGSFIGYDPSNGNQSSLIDLNTVTSNLTAAGFTSLNLAYSINDNGWIVGQGVATNGQNHAFLLKPTSTVPEPSAILALGLGVFGAGFAFRRRSA